MQFWFGGLPGQRNSGAVGGFGGGGGGADADGGSGGGGGYSGGGPGGKQEQAGGGGGSYCNEEAYGCARVKGGNPEEMGQVKIRQVRCQQKKNMGHT